MTRPAAKHRSALLTVAEMGAADRFAIAVGTPGLALMEAAGRAVAAAGRATARARDWDRPQTAVLCGPGNNGGDGFVAARILAEAGWPVTVAALAPSAGLDKLPDDARANAERWRAMGYEIGDARAGLPVGARIVIDALFGAGLNKPLRDDAAALVEAVNQARREAGVAVVAVDMPSGVDGDSGRPPGAGGGAANGAPRAVEADLTVTFFRRKTGHLLLPGRTLCGELVVADIGIPDASLDEIRPTRFANDPALWIEDFPWPRPGGQKYDRGMALIVGGAELTGAARLAATAALRAGAGLATILAPRAALPVYRTGPAAIMARALPDRDGFGERLADSRTRAVLLGPGNGVGAATAERARAAIASGKPLVLDADAITSFADRPGDLQGPPGGKPPSGVLTPHAGELKRVYPEFNQDDNKIEQAIEFSVKTGFILLLKGADTVIAAPDGRALVNHNAPPELATAGAGDVLAGFIVGLLAAGMPPFEAAGAAAWLHGAAAQAFGPGLIAEDLADQLPGVLRRLRAESGG